MTSRQRKILIVVSAGFFVVRYQAAINRSTHAA
jgi:hypothetical protein